MAKYQQYAEYKDSGVEWLSQLPVGWDIERTKRMLCLRRQLVGADSLNYQLLSLTLRGVIPRDISNGDGKIPADFSTYQEVETKDLVFCLFDIDETPRTVGLSQENGMITGAYNVYRTSDICSSRYAYYYFLHIDLRKGLRPFYTGLRKVVRSETFGNIKMPCPPYKEQAKIADFLDHETAQIDTLIEKQQTLIQLLKEKRQAVISHAVTKGLNPGAPMKDSGVEWLGEVPAHWVVATLRRVISRMEQGKSPQCESSPAKLDEWGVLKTSCVNGGRFNEEENKLLPSNIAPHEEYEVQAGDLLMSRASGSINLIGSVVLVQDNVRTKLLLSDKIFRIYLSENYDSLFFAYLMSSSYMRSSIEIAISGAEGMANNIAKSSIMEFIIPILPLDEQVEIASYLKVAETKYMALISKAEQAIQLMQERRTALISAAVTGKIDVRGWVAPESF